MATCAETKNPVEDEDKPFVWNLDTIPQEIFLHICTFLSAKFIVNVLSKVCSRFREIIEDDSTWRIRLQSRLPKPYPVVLHSSFVWKDACCETEEQKMLWCNDGENMLKFDLKGAHAGAVDVVQIIENGSYCISGARDRAIKLWNLNILMEHKENINPELVIQSCCAEISPAHAGWIWSTAYAESDHTLYSGSWDSTIKSWNIDSFSSFHEATTYSSKSPVLCLAFSDKILVSGSYDKQIAFFDPRSGLEPISQQSYHRRAVLCIAADDKFVISGSEDNTVTVFNRVAGKVQNTIELEHGYAMSLSYAYHNLWVGDSKGYIHVVDPNDELFQLVHTYHSEHRCRINGIHYTLGSLISCSADKKLQVSVPCGDLYQISTLMSKSEYAGISGFGQILASANCDHSITIWMPKQEVN